MNNSANQLWDAARSLGPLSKCGLGHSSGHATIRLGDESPNLPSFDSNRGNAVSRGVR